jgi:hypothetical protein
MARAIWLGMIDLLVIVTLMSGIIGILLTVVVMTCECAGCRRDATIVSYCALACFAVFMLSLARLTHVI